jgi:branched-chain amino acid transport system substrate-binding protein
MNQEQPTMQPDKPNAVTPDADSAMPMSQPTPGAKKPMMLWGVVGVAVLVVGAGLAWYFTRDTKPPVVKHTYKVGLMTVDEAVQASSTAIKHGVELAQKAFETEGVSIEVVTKETSCDGEAAAKAMTEFATEGVVAVIGEFCSDATLAAATVANDKHIPLISAASTSSKVSSAGDYVYRTIPADTLSTDFAAQAMYKTYKVHKLAILHTDDSYGNDTAAGLTKAMTALGGSVSVDKRYTGDQTDITSEVTAVKNSDADGLFVVGVTLNDSILQKKKELGLTLPTFGPEYFSDSSLLESAGAAAEGLYVIAPSNGTTEFAEKYQASFKETPPSYAAQAYDAVGAIMKGLDAGATTGQTLKAKLDSISFKGVTGTIAFDKNGDVSGNFQVFIVKDGKPLLLQ